VSAGAVSVPNRDGELLDQLEAELRRRLKLRQTKLAVFGDWEVESETSRRSEWDADALEQAMQALVDDGVVRAGDIADVIRREPVVSLSKARDLAARLDGDAKASVEACRTWKEKPGPLRVVRSVQLPTADEIRALRGDTDGRPGEGSAAVPPAADQPQLTAEELFA
jgi:hypothetical protein